MKYRRILLLLVVLVCALWCSAQSPKPLSETEKDLVPQRVMFRYNESSLYTAQLAACIEFLKIAFTTYTQTVIVYEKPDVIVELDAEKSGTSIILTITSTRADTNVSVLQKEKNFTVFAISEVQNFLTAFAQEADKLLPPLPQKERFIVTEKVVEKTETVQVARGVTITFQGMPFTTLYFYTSKKTEKLDAEGKLTIEQPQNTSLKFRASAPRYTPYEKTVFIGKEDITITIELKPLSTIEIEGTLRYASLVLGIHGRYFLQPGNLFVDIGLQSSLLSLIPFMDTGIYWHELSLGGGLLLEDPLAFLSGAVALSIMGRIETATGTVRFPAVLPFAVNLDLIGYMKLLPAVRIAVGATTRLGFVNSPPENMPADLYADLYKYTSVPYDLGPNWKIFYPEPFLALRIGL